MIHFVPAYTIHLNGTLCTHLHNMVYTNLHNFCVCTLKQYDLHIHKYSVHVDTTNPVFLHEIQNMPYSTLTQPYIYW